MVQTPVPLPGKKAAPAAATSPAPMAASVALASRPALGLQRAGMPLLSGTSTAPTTSGSIDVRLSEQSPTVSRAVAPVSPRRSPGTSTRQPVSEMPLARSVDSGAAAPTSTDTAADTAAVPGTFVPMAPFTVSRSVDSTESTEVPIQMVEETSSSPGAEASSATSADGGAATAGGVSSPEEVEALAHKLAVPMMRRIRAEMLLDRERRGLRTDSW